MPAIHPQKTVCPEKVCQGEKLLLRIGFETVGDLCREPLDLILAMDLSGSMGGEPLRNAKEGAAHMVSLLLGSTLCQCPCSGTCFPGGCRMGLIGFSCCAKELAPLSENPEPVLCALKQMKAGGNTNHMLAFLLAQEMFCCSKCRKKVLVLFTDGPSNQGCPGPAAEELKKMGVEIYCIFLGDCCFDRKMWASAPRKTHVRCPDEPAGLCRAFSEITAEVTGSTIHNVRILEKVAEDFKICSVRAVSRGRAAQLDDRTVEWLIPSAGEQGEEKLELTLEIVCCSEQQGCRKVNEWIHYGDDGCSCLVFPNPEVRICGCPPCPGWIPAGPCEDIIDGCPVEASVSGLGRIVTVSAVIRDVCPGKALGAAVILSELVCGGKEENRGMKIFEIPPQQGEGCRDLQLNCIRFVVPERGHCPSLCKKRVFRARVIANYLDTDFTCCEGEASLSQL